jgi:hypothetical protein
MLDIVHVQLTAWLTLCYEELTERYLAIQSAKYHDMHKCG